MRSFIVLLLAGVFSLPWASLVMASDQNASLFRIELAKTPTQTFDALLNRAMQLELIRLTGSLSVLHNADAKQMIKQPKAWLSNYGYQPRMQDGVKVGETVFFEFDADRIYSHFQKVNLVVWPKNSRPKLLVMASQSMAGSLTKLTRSNLEYRSDVAFRDFANNVGLKIHIPASEVDWLLPKSDLDSEILSEMLESTNSTYFLTLALTQSIKGEKALTWKLYSRNLDIVSSQTLTQRKSSRAYLKQAFYQVQSLLSQRFRNHSTEVNEIELQVNSITSFKKFDALEHFLESQKSLFKGVSLTSLAEGTATFKLVYQGSLELVMQKLHSNLNLVVTGKDELSQTIKAEWE